MSRKKLPVEVLEFFWKQGAKGGKLGGVMGGRKAAANMTPKERIARAKRASDAAGVARKAKKKHAGGPPRRPQGSTLQKKVEP